MATSPILSFFSLSADDYYFKTLTRKFWKKIKKVLENE